MFLSYYNEDFIEKEINHKSFIKGEMENAVEIATNYFNKHYNKDWGYAPLYLYGKTPLGPRNKKK